MIRASLCVWLLAFVLLMPAQAQEHPPAPKLLPERTVVLVRIRNVQETRAKFNDTAMGKILQDDQVGPLVSKLYQSVNETYAQIEEQVGVPLEQLVQMPQGEAWLAVMGPKYQGDNVDLAFLLDVRDRLPAAKKLLERGEKLLEENGGSKKKQLLGETQVTVYLPPGVSEPETGKRIEEASGKEVETTIAAPGSIIHFERDGALVFASSFSAAEDILTGWNGKLEKTLGGNDHFGAVMNRCRNGNDEPEFEWFVNPLALVKAAAKGNPTVQTGLAIVPALGLDGLQAIGGTMTLGSGEFDEVQHIHLLLDNPRTGALELLALTGGDTKPEPWVPHDVMSYLSLNWDVGKTWLGAAKLYDSFSAEGRAEQWVKQRVEESLGIDFTSELLPAIEGRVIFCNWNEPPARLNSGANLLGVKLNDAKGFQAVFEKITAKFSDRLEKKAFGATNYYRIIPRNRREFTEEEEAQIRRPEPAMIISGDYFLISDSEKFLTHALTAQASGKSLSEELDFKLIEAKVKRSSGANPPGFMRFDRPEEGLRMLYDLATADSTRGMLSKEAEENEFLKKVDSAMKEHPLPPFAVLAKYLAPGGGLITSDETGFHFSSFTLKRK